MQFTTLARHARPPQYEPWLQLALSTGQADPFGCTPSWQLAFQDAFNPARRLLIAEEEGSVMAFAENRAGEEEIYITPLEFSWFFGCPLLGEGAPRLFAEAVHFFARAYAPHFPKIIIGGLAPGSDGVRTLLEHAGMPLRARLVGGNLLGVASLSGGLDGYLSRRTANHRRNLKREAAKAKEQGIHFERVLPTTEREAQDAFDRMLAVERASWKGLGHCGMAEPMVCDFYAFLLRRMAPAKEGRIIFARREDEDVGFIFGGMAGRIYRGQQFSYAQRWHELSIGNLMQMEKIRWLCEEGATRYDMGSMTGPKMQYKAHWVETALPIRTWLIEKM